MSSQAHSPGTPQRDCHVLRWLASCLAALLIFSVDTFTHLQSGVAALYVLVLVIADDGASRRPVLSFALASGILALLSFMLTHLTHPGMGSVLRLLFSLAIVGITALLILRNRTMQAAIRDQDMRYRTIFDTLAVAIWEHDFRALQRELAMLRSSGIGDLRAFLNGHPDVIVRFRKLVPIANANKSAFNLLQVPDGEPFFTHLHHILPDDDESFLEGLMILDGGGGLFETETRLRTWHGGAVDVFVALTFPSGAGVGCISGSITDVTDRKRAQSALERTRSELDRTVRATTVGEMSASIAHEVSQPLTAVRTCIEASRRWLDRAGPNIGEALNAIRQAAHEAENAGEVVNRVRRLVSRVEPDMTVLEMDHVVETAVDLARRQFSRAHMTVSLGVESGKVRGDRILLQQLLINLIGNAVEACADLQDGARIAIATAWADRAIAITVADKGTGMALETLERAFDPFYSTRVGAIGLGLTMCRSIVEAHGGTIAITAAPGRVGTSVTVELPRSPDG